MGKYRPNRFHFKGHSEISAQYWVPAKIYILNFTANAFH